VPPAIIGGAIAAAGAVGGSIIASNGAKSAANTQAKSAADQLALQKELYESNKSLFTPDINNGDIAAQREMALLGLAPLSTGGTPASVDWAAYLHNTPAAMASYGDYNTYYPANAATALLAKIAQARGQSTAPNTVPEAGLSAADYGKWYYDHLGNGADISQYTTPGTPGQTAQQAQQAAFDQFRAAPGYQFKLSEALKGVNSNAYAAGLGNSGATLRALQSTAMGLADQSYNQYLSSIDAIANRGAGAKSSLSGVSQNFGNATNAISQNAANAQSSASMAQAAIGAQGLSGALNGVGQILGSSYGHSSLTPGVSNYFAPSSGLMQNVYAMQDAHGGIF